MKLTISLVSPQTITGLLQEFDVQASRRCGFPSPSPLLSLLSPFFHGLDACSDIRAKGRDGSGLSWFPALSSFSPERSAFEF